MADEPELWNLDWDRLYPQVLKAALDLTKGAQNRKNLAADLAHTAILKTQDGTRRWNREMPILDHLVSTMRSQLSHLRKSYLYKNVVQDDGVVVNMADYLTLTPEDNMLCENFIEYVMVRNTTSGHIARLMLNVGLKTTREISERLNMKVNSINQGKISLRNITLDYLGYPRLAQVAKTAGSLLKVLDKDESDDE